jgi:hypothetical protein
MKLFSIIAMLVAMCGVGVAGAIGPIDNGSVMINGSASYTTTSMRGAEDNTSVISVTPSFGYFVLNHLAIGGVAVYNTESTGAFDATTWGAGPSVRMYLGLSKSPFFVSADWTYLKSSESFTDEVTSESSMTDLALGGGVAIFLGKNVAFEPFAKYHIINGGFDTPDLASPNETNLEIGAGLGIYLW